MLAASPMNGAEIMNEMEAMSLSWWRPPQDVSTDCWMSWLRKVSSGRGMMADANSLVRAEKRSGGPSEGQDGYELLRTYRTK
jgi:hypothetical protein